MAKNPSASAYMPLAGAKRERFKLFNLAYIVLFAALAAIYLFITITHPPSASVLRQVHLTENGYHWLLAAIFAIFGIIWLSSLYGSLVFKSYAHMIRQSADGSALNHVGNGLLVLAIAQPIGLFISSLNAVVVSHHPSLLPKLTIFYNYVGLFLMGVSMVLIAIGAEYIYMLAKYKISWLTRRLWVIGFIIISAAYSYFVVIQPIHSPEEVKVYFLPDWLLVFSIAIPYVIFWYLGLNSAFLISRFRKKTRGSLYRGSLKYLAAGIAAVIISSIVTRIITTVSPRLTHLSLTPLLFVIFGLLIIDSIGFLLIAIGAIRLRRLEEV